MEGISLLSYSSVMVCSFDEGVGRAWEWSKDFDYASASELKLPTVILHVCSYRVVEGGFNIIDGSI